MTRRKRILLATAAVLVVGAGAAWHWQSFLIGHGTRWYLDRIAASEEARGELGERRQAVGRVNRMLLLAPAPDALVPELFDVLTALSARVATGEIDLAWAAYVFTSHQRDLTRDRPRGVPRLERAEVDSVVEEYVRFFSLQKRPDAPGLGVRDLAGGDDAESFTLEEIEAAMRDGRDLTRSPAGP